VANLPLAFAEIVAGGVTLVAGLSGDTIGNVMRGQITYTGFGASSTSGSQGGATSSSTSTAPTSVGKNAGGLVKTLVAQGLTPIAAAGVVGNLQQESSLNPGAPGGGLAQWIGSRYDDLVSYASAHGLSPASASAQIGYLISDLTGNYASTLSAMNAASTPAEAAAIFSNEYERPGTPDLSNRQNYAQAAYTAAGY
jgi:hypothetical protein